MISRSHRSLEVRSGSAPNYTETRKEPLSLSAPESQRFKSQRLQDANATKSQTLAFYKSQHLFPKYQKNPRVRKIRVRNSGAGNGRANFMDTWKKCLLSAGKPAVHKIPRFRGGVFWVWGGGGKCRFYFYGRGDFSENNAFSESPVWVDSVSQLCSQQGSNESFPLAWGPLVFDFFCPLDRT